MLREEIRNIKGTKKDFRMFGLTVGGVLLALGLFMLWRERPAHVWLLGCGAFLSLSGVLFPSLLKPLYKVWMSFAVVAGWVMTRIVLSVLYFIVVTPIGLLARLAGKRFLDLQWRSSQKSYWNHRETAGHVREHDERQF
jgi:hypothetical protein